MKRAVFVILATAISVSAMLAQAPITGRIVADDTGEPVQNARVALSTPDQPDRTVALSDRDGRFFLPAPPGRHSVVATKTGFARGTDTSAGGAAALEIRLRRAAAISGRVVDEGGDPVFGVLVTVETQGASSTAVGRAITDDRGEYRVGGLSAGTFVVALSTNMMVAIQPTGPASSMRMTPGRIQTFYPNATERRDAEALRIDWGADRGGVDFVLPYDRVGMQPFGAGPAMMTTAVMALNAPGSRSPPQSTAATSSVLRGRVRAADGSALPRARVLLASRPSSTMADSNGSFEFRDLPAGAYRIAASKAGFFNNAATVEIKPGQTRDDVSVTLEPWGVIAGVLTDENGDPIQGARIELLQIRYENGRRALAPARADSFITDDRGAYRAYGVRPGQYIVSAEVGAVATTALPGYARTLFPGTAVPAQAQFVSIGRFPEVSGVDFSMVRSRTLRVTGRLINADNQPGGGSLQIMPSHRSVVPMTVSAGARIFPDGRFEFANVLPGDYVIHAYRGRTSSWTEGEFGMARVTAIESDVDGVLLQTSRGSSITGRVVFDSALGSRPPTVSGVEITPVPVDPDLSPRNNLATANIARDGGFVIEGLNGPRRLEVTRTPPGWVLKAVRVGGIEVTDRVLPFGTARESLRDVEVELTDRLTEVRGTARDDRTRPAPNLQVIVFPVERSLWYPRSRHLQRARSDPAGAFSIAGLPAGSYYAAAVAAVPTDGDDAWQDPVFLESLMPSAETVLVGEGQRVTVNPRLAR